MSQLPLYVSLELSPTATDVLMTQVQTHLSFYDFSHYSVKRGLSQNGHITLAFSSDFPLTEYQDIVQTYKQLESQSTTHQVEIKGIAVDSHCVAVLVDPLGLPVYPKTKLPHITLMLNGKQPVYSNTLLTTIHTKTPDFNPTTKAISETYSYHPFTTQVTGTLKFIGNFKPKKTQPTPSVTKELDVLMNNLHV